MDLRSIRVDVFEDCISGVDGYSAVRVRPLIQLSGQLVLQIGFLPGPSAAALAEALYYACEGCRR